MLADSKTHIGTLRIRGANENTPSMRLSLSSMLGSIDMRPGGLSPSAVLIVKSLPDPLPGHFLPGMMRIDPEWERAVQSSLEGIYHRSVRPIGGIIPYNASAVLFAHEAELLACLLLDASCGMAGERWWWKVIIRNFPNIKMGGLKGIMQVSAVNLPAALFQIYEWGQISSVFSALTPQDSEEVFNEVGREYGIPEPQIRRFIVEMRKIEAGKKQRDDPEGELKQEGSRRQDFSEIRDYLRSIIRQDRTFSIHGKEKLSLFALCLVLRHRPSLSRTQVLVPGLLEFVAEFPGLNTGYAFHEEKIGKTDRVLQIEDIKKKDESLFIPEYGHENKINTPDIENKGRKIITKFDFKSIGKSSVDIQHADEKPELYVKKVPSIRQFPVELGKDTKEHYAIETDVQTEVSKENEKNSDIPVLSADEAAPDLSPEIEDQKIASQDDDSSIFQDNGINTQLCGVFYLINLMRELDLPECFEEDFGLSSQVGAWGTLELLARAIIGNDDRFNSDPVWDILAGLDGRKDGTLAGNQMNDSKSYKMPQLWFEKCKQKMDAGFYWDDSAPVEGIEGVLPGLSPQLSGLMSCIMPFIRWYLRLALDPGAKKEEPEKDMLICNGRLYITSTHIDIMMKLDDISIPVRMAGLDADPGWAADFGRVVKFHFE